MPYEIGQRVADYEIVGHLGVGGMGRVYRVCNAISNRTEAMKVLLADFSADPDLAARFVSEIRTLAALRHPNIAQLHTAIQLENELLMMMEFVDGCTLQKLAQQNPLPPEQVVSYMHQVLAALSFAHSRGVIHRDIKPANIMVTAQGQIKLTDFGIAKSKLQHELTRPGTTVGSLNYMSPEQARGGSSIDGRADLYSLGITMYELLAGQLPFDDESAYVVMHRQLNAEPRPPIELNPLLTRSLNDIVLKALEKDPAKRFQNAAAFSDALRKATGIAPSTHFETSSVFLPATFEPAPPQRSHAALPGPRIALRALGGVGALGCIALTIPQALTYGVLAKAVTPLTVRAGMITGAARQGTLPGIRQPVAFTAAASPVTQANDAGSGTVPGSRTSKKDSVVQSGAEAVSSQVVASNGLGDDAPVDISAKAASSTPRVFKRTVAYSAHRATLPPAGPSLPKASLSQALPLTTEMRELRSHQALLIARASPLRLSVLQLKSQQEAAGEVLGQDVAGAYVRMNTYLSAGKADLDDGDAAAARDHLTRAETEVDTLETLLRR